MAQDTAQSHLSAGTLEDLPHDYYARDIVRDQLAALRDLVAGRKSVEQCSIDLVGIVPKDIAIGSVANEDSDSEDDHDPAYDAVCNLMGNIQHIAVENPAHQPVIVVLLQALKRLPPQEVLAPVKSATKAHDAEDIVWGTKTINWANMPQFSAQLTDTYEYQSHLFTSSPSVEAVILRWASVNALVARLASAWDPEYVFYLHRASYRFLRVLDIEEHPHFQGELPAAANLFRYASPVLLRLSREEPPMPGVPIGIFAEKPREYDEGQHVLWKGHGYSISRWEWWKTRWGQLVAAEDFGEDLRKHAEEALAAMNAAEL